MSKLAEKYTDLDKLCHYKEVVQQAGGGHHFFRIKVNLNKKECYDLPINGNM